MLIALQAALATDVGVRARYPFDNSRNDAVNSFNASETGVSYSTTRKCGTHSADLDGSSDYFTLPDSLKSTMNSWTVSIWFRPDSGTQSWERVWDFGDTDGSAGGFMVEARNGRTGGTAATIHRNSSSNADISCGSSPASSGNWHHAAFVFQDNVGSRFYLDGQLCGTDAWWGKTLADFANNDLQMYVGRSNWSGDPDFDGRVDELRIYDRALSDGEVKSLNAVACGPWPDADGDGTTDSIDDCVGDDATGDVDNDGYCADVDCDDTRNTVYPGAHAGHRRERP
ncbi:MAG: LamG domain-containing protein [Alphaproteobacteria bacterium]|nr:LamG domain-containing protein [Alphaproteobacteria bacterium]MCB9694780.1 LamG domain-containing protein [Alphaproteobacteria bacterium]